MATWADSVIRDLQRGRKPEDQGARQETAVLVAGQGPWTVGPHRSCCRHLSSVDWLEGPEEGALGLCVQLRLGSSTVDLSLFL